MAYGPMEDSTSEGPRVAPEYLHDLNRCPVCGSRDITGSAIDIEGDMVFQDLRCHRCGAEWYEAYSIHHRCVQASGLPEGVSLEDVERAVAEPFCGRGGDLVDLVTVEG